MHKFPTNVVLQIGKSKVFLRAGQMAELDARRTKLLADSARCIQRQIRTHLTRKEFIAVRRAAIHMQKLWRGNNGVTIWKLEWHGVYLTLPQTGQLARKMYEQIRKEAASIRIQKHLRAHTARKSYIKFQAVSIVIQTGLRAMAARNDHRNRKRTKAANIIQVINALDWTIYRNFNFIDAYRIFLAFVGYLKM